MNDDYRKDIESIHASEELIEKTLRSVRQEKKKNKNGSAKIIKFSSAAVAAAAAILVFTNINMSDQSHYAINSVEHMEVRSNDISGLFSSSEDEEKTIMTEDELNDQVGVDCEKLFDSISFYKAEMSADKGTFYYESKDTGLSVSFSKNDDIIPKSMNGLEKSDIDGHEVLLAKDKNNYYASGKENGVNYYMVVRCSSDKAFKKLIKEFQKTFLKK